MHVQRAAAASMSLLVSASIWCLGVDARQTPIVSPTYPTRAPNLSPAPAPDPPVIQTVNVGGYPVRVRVGGVGYMAKAPAVVFESGATSKNFERCQCRTSQLQCSFRIGLSRPPGRPARAHRATAMTFQLDSGPNFSCA